MSKKMIAALVAALVGIGLLLLIPGCGQQASEEVAAEAGAQTEAMPSQVAPAPVRQGALLDLVAAGGIQANVSGSSIENVSLSLRNLTTEPIAVQIPAGTFFASNSASAQSMVATRPQEAHLEPGQELSISIDAACANLPLDIPDSGTSFTIAQAPPQGDLTRIAPSLASETYAVRQAAVWMITDNANYNDLGILVSGSYSGYGGSRVIGPDDAAKAMRLLSRAGVDLRNRSIWNDRQMLAGAVQDAELRAWLVSLG